MRSRDLRAIPMSPALIPNVEDPIAVADQRAQIDAVIAELGGRPGSTMLILNRLQSDLGHISRPMQNYIAEKLNVPLKDVYGVVTFYSFFTMKPRGKHVIRVCMGTACHVRGAAKILDRLVEKLAVQPGETSADRMVTLETVNCVGACALGPVVVADNAYSGQMNVAKADRLLKTILPEQK